MNVAVVLNPPSSAAASKCAGIVQGVGFRPFVYRLALELGLAGFVRNDPTGVIVEVEGEADRVDRFVTRVQERRAAALARRRVTGHACRVEGGAASGFAILESGRGRAATAIGADSAVCACCLRELFTPTDRRYRYAFINCTHCGPRYTITRQLPYDRAMTSMARVRPVPALPGRVPQPLDRRFHAEPNACPVCGPRLAFLDEAGAPVRGTDPIAEVVARLAAGRHHRDQGSGRLPSRVRRAQRRCRGAAALAQGARGEAAGGDGRERGVARMRSRTRGRPSARCSRRPSGRSSCCARRDGRRCAAAGRRAGPRLARRDAAVHAAALPALPRSGRPPADPDWLARAAAARAGDDQRQSRRRAARHRQRRGARAPARHRRRLPRARPRHRRRLRRQRRARAARQRGPGLPVRAPRARLHAAGDPPRARRPAGARGRRLLQEHRVRDARRRGVRLAARRRPRQRGDVQGARARRPSTCCRSSTCAPALVVHDLHPDFHSTRFGARSPRARACRCCGVQHHHAHIAAVAGRASPRGPGAGPGARRRRASAPTARRGAANCCWSTASAARASATCGPAAARRRPRGARAVAHGRGRAGARAGRAREIAARFADEPGARAGRHDARARPARAADVEHGSLVRCGGGPARRDAAAWRSKDRRRCSSRASRSGTDRWRPTARCTRSTDAHRARPDAAREPPGRRARCRLRRGAVPRDARRPRSPTGSRGSRRGTAFATVAAGGGCMLNAILADGLRTALARHGVRLRRSAAVAAQRRRPFRSDRPAIGLSPPASEPLTMCLAIPARVDRNRRCRNRARRRRRRAQAHLAGAGRGRRAAATT